jgi:predicted ribosomally synthesized peptide with SipW-like signal peptide/uncharacterized repeat protein (TIGR01451 family)
MGRKPPHPAADQLQLFDVPVPRARERGARRTPARGRRRERSTLRLGIPVLALGIATAGIIAGSYASWQAQTTNPGNQVTAGTLTMSNNKNGAAVFTAAPNAKPGDTGSNTVTITNTGSVPMSVTLTQDQLAGTAIESSLELQIYDAQRNWCYWPLDASGSCGANWGAWNASATFTNFAIPNSSGGAQWAAAEAHTFTVSWRLLTSSPNTDQGQTGSFRLAWGGAS